MRQNADKLMLRLPAGLRDRVRSAARQNHRSMNAEVIVHLERALCGSSQAVRPNTDAPVLPTDN